MSDQNRPARWKARLDDVVTKTLNKLAVLSTQKKEGSKQTFRIENLEPTALMEWMSGKLQGQNARLYGTLIVIALCAYFLSDLSALLVGKYIPEPPATRVSGAGPSRRTRTLEEYAVIFKRNLFNSKGIIPGETEVAPSGPAAVGGPAVKTTLPFNLIGTLIMKNELRSIATIEDTSAQMVYPVQLDDEIPSKARITKIEATRVTFVNLSSGRNEYLEMPEDIQTSNPRITLGSKSGGAPTVEKVGNNQFNVSRSEVDRTLSDLNNVLTQARAVPNFKNGMPDGYKLFQIAPGSIYEKLGLQNGDAITGLNGTPINDPGKAFEMLNELKTSSHLELQVERDNRPSTYTYEIR